MGGMNTAEVNCIYIPSRYTWAAPADVVVRVRRSWATASERSRQSRTRLIAGSWCGHPVHHRPCALAVWMSMPTGRPSWHPSLLFQAGPAVRPHPLLIVWDDNLSLLSRRHPPPHHPPPPRRRLRSPTRRAAARAPAHLLSDVQSALGTAPLKAILGVIAHGSPRNDWEQDEPGGRTTAPAASCRCPLRHASPPAGRAGASTGRDFPSARFAGVSEPGTP